MSDVLLPYSYLWYCSLIPTMVGVAVRRLILVSYDK